MKYVLIFLKAIGIQIFRGFIIGTCILLVSFWLGYKNTVELTNILFIFTGIFILFGEALFSPKGLGFLPSRRSPIYVKMEASDDMSLVGLPEDEQKKTLSIESFIVLIETYGVGVVLFVYSLIFYKFFGS